MRRFAISLTLLACILSAPLLADDALTSDPLQASLAQAAAAFQQARVADQLDAATKLASPDVRIMTDDGREGRTLKKAFSRLAFRKQQPPLTTISRHCRVQGHIGIVEEILALKAASSTNQKRMPLRQSSVWQFTAGRWQLLHMHISDYDRWEPSITAFERQDASELPAAGGAVFVGSSSIRMWKTLQQDFDTATIQRGFGGSQLVDSIAYAPRIITCYQPQAVAIYAGDNDIAAGKSAQQVAADFRALVQAIHADCPQAEIGYIAIKPSLSRWKLWPEMRAANESIAEFATTKARVTYLDIATPMLDEEGRPRESLFVKDGLHLSAEGYKVWTNTISPWLTAAMAAEEPAGQAKN